MLGFHACTEYVVEWADAKVSLRLLEGGLPCQGGRSVARGSTASSLVDRRVLCFCSATCARCEIAKGVVFWGSSRLAANKRRHHRRSAELGGYASRVPARTEDRIKGKKGGWVEIWASNDGAPRRDVMGMVCSLSVLVAN